MREHMGIFRGKRTDNGEWVEGFYAHFKDLYKDKETHRIYTPFAESDCGEFYPDWYEVDPTTIGECTSHKDKNGKWIFEGDIVRCVARLDEANCVVIYEQGEFRLVPERYYKTYVTGGGYHALRCFDKEIIGNIYDNPELLKGGEG